MASTRLLFLSVAFAVFSAAPGYAQFAPSVRSGVSEFGLYAGASYGVDKFRPMGGVNLSHSINRFVLPYAEFSYFPGLVRKSGDVRGEADLIDFHGGVHLRFPREESRFVPYLVGGFGVLRSAIKLGSGSVRDEFTETDPAVNFGVGLRHYTNERFGLRAEYKLYRPLRGLFENFFHKTEVGFFFQF